MIETSKSSRIEELFEAAIALPPSGREGYLKAQCGDDAGLLEELQRLVRGHETAGDDFLRPPPAEPRWQALFRRDDGPDPLIGARIGRYTIKSVIGVGGMGTVYLAEQESPRREIALKVMTAGVLTTRSALRRFEYESQILAKLRHPNIAHVYEAGTADVIVAADAPVGRREGEGEAPAEPSRTVRVAYFAMEYIPGAKSITRYAAENGLAARERLDLFLQACDAVQYGHTKGVIHRDLKPGNILVGDETVAARVPARPCGTGVSPVSSDNVAPRCTSGPSAVSSATGKMPVPHRRSGATQSEIRNPQPALDVRRGNVACQGSEIVKVIDFGVAKSTDSDVALTTARTDVGQIIGTLQYMSPEQAGGTDCGTGVSPVNRGTGSSPAGSADIDTRSDVYSLGVVLYELLTERLPYDVSNMTLHSAMRRICEQAPTKPSALRNCGTGILPVNCGTGVSPVRCGTGVSPVKGDLETIILKALEKDREKRYQSAADLAADIRRYLAGEPIDARPPTRWTRTMRWVARHPLATTAAACLLLVATVTIGTIASVWWLGLRPDRILMVWDEARTPGLGVSGRCARLLSFIDANLHEWPRDAKPGESNVSHAHLVDRDRALGGGKLAVVGYQLGGRSEFAGGLCAYELAGNLDKPIWQNRIDREDVPPELLAIDRGPEIGSPQGANAGITADIFDGPDAPGEEIVVIFNAGPFSQRALRILNQQGDVLFQVWHDGDIASMYWWSAQRLLFCTASDEYLKLNYPSFNTRLGAPTASVVFAIRPIRGLPRNEFMARTPDEEATFRPVWAKYVEQPNDRSLRLDLQVTPPPDADPTRFTWLKVNISSKEYPEPEWFRWLINERGEVEGKPTLGDKYNIDQSSSKPRLPEPATIKLLDLPPAKSRPPYLKPESPEQP